MQTNTKRRWIKTSNFWDLETTSVEGRKAIKYLNKLANRKFRHCFKNIPVRKLMEYENEIQGGVENWYY